MRPTFMPILVAALLAAFAAEAAPSANHTALPTGGVFARPTGNPTLPPVQTGSVLAPLSAQECKDLGGEVSIAGICKSGQSCQRKDETGKQHEVCLSAN